MRRIYARPLHLYVGMRFVFVVSLQGARHPSIDAEAESFKTRRETLNVSLNVRLAANHSPVQSREGGPAEHLASLKQS